MGRPFLITAWKVTNYGFFSGPYFPVFGLNTERSKSWYSVRMQKNTDQKKLRIWTVFTRRIHEKYKFKKTNILIPAI